VRLRKLLATVGPIWRVVTKRYSCWIHLIHLKVPASQWQAGEAERRCYLRIHVVTDTRRRVSFLFPSHLHRIHLIVDANSERRPLHTTMSQRQSTAPLPPSLQNLLHKQQEHAGLQALKEASATMLERVEKLAEMSNVMADGGEGGRATFRSWKHMLICIAVGNVLRNWPHVFSILNLFGQLLRNH
jgi:hypothetical protein